MSEDTFNFLDASQDLPETVYDFNLKSRNRGIFREKYRPQTLEECAPTFDLNLVRDIIKNPKDKNIILLHGQTGGGKTTVAQIIAKGLICSSVEEKPCLSCEACLDFEKNNTDIQFRNISNENKIDDIRSLIEEFNYRPHIFDKKIYILDEVHRLTKDAQSALLTVMENIKPYIYLVLCTTDPQQLSTAFKTRATSVVFKPIAAKYAGQVIAQVASLENIDIEDSEIEKVFSNSEGSIRQLLNELEKLSVGSLEGKDDEETKTLVKDISFAIINKNINKLASLLESSGVRSDLENIQRGISCYLRGSLLREAKKSKDASAVIRLSKAVKYVSTKLDNQPLINYNEFVANCFLAGNLK